MLCVQNLTKRYGALTAVERVSFEVRPGEVFGLLGPNGSGKSTIVKILMGLLEPSQGGVELDGKNALANLQEYKRLLGYVPEEPHLYTYLTGPNTCSSSADSGSFPMASSTGRSISFSNCSASTMTAIRRCRRIRKACARRCSLPPPFSTIRAS